MNADQLLVDVQHRLHQGLFDEAASLARDRDTRPIKDSDLHVEWADCLEELGLMDEVILELNLAIRDNPERLELYPRLADVMCDQGQPHRAVRVWEALIKRQPEQPKWYEGLVQGLRESKDFEKAREACSAALEKTGDNRFKTLARELGFLDGAAHSAEPSADAEQLTPQQRHLVTFSALFAGREGVHARQWVSPTGESGYTPVEEPFSQRVAENHILGNYTVGIYPVRLDNTVNFIAFDFDAAKFAVKSSIKSERAWTGLLEKVQKTACGLMDLAAQNDTPLYLEDSGFKGRHAWIFLDEPVPAGVARRFGETLAGQLAPLPPEVTVEVFPKQTSVRRGGLGNLIKLPLGIHRRTGKRALFIEPGGAPVADQLGMLETVSKARKRTIYGVIQRLHGTMISLAPRPEPSPDDAPDAEVEPEAPRRAAAPSLPEVYDLDRDPQFQHLVAKCPTIAEIVAKVNQTSMISKDETQALIHTLGHLDQGPDAVNAIFRRCLNADPALFLKSRLRGHPMSCPKIRTRLPEKSSRVACNCVFDLSVNLYPTPLIHVSSVSQKTAVSPLGLTVDSLQFQNLVQDYLKLRKQSREIRLLLERYEERLREFFDDAGVESVETPTGKLTIVKKDGDKVSFTLEV
jgi:hypothetical protein